VSEDPFGVLGLPRSAGLSDDDVRAAWRRIASATHPDREDGGDPAWYSAAGAAYATLRTGYGRGEALADLADGRSGSWGEGGGRGRRGVLWRRGGREGRGGPWRRGGRGRRGVRGARGRPGVLALRVIAAAAVSVGAFAVAGWAPASIAVLTGAVTWLVATGRHDLAPRAHD
jgi:curved DNA-binding protein CbpA